MGAVAAQAACKGRAQLKARAERAQNMLVMSVTLDVSKLSGWLNASARCHIKCRGMAYDMGQGASREAVRRGPEAAQAACTGRARLKAVGARARAERTQNMLIMFVTLGVSKFSGWLNAIACCRVQGRVYNVQRGAGWEAGGCGGDSGKRHARGGPNWKLGGRARAGAHIKHAVHACDAGRVEAQRLVERNRVLPSRKERAFDAAKGAAREAGGCGAAMGRRWRKRHVHEEGPTQSLEPGARAESTRNI